MDRLPQISVKATKVKASGVQTVCTRGIHVQHSKAERYHTGASKFTDTITAVYGMYMGTVVV